MYYPDWPFDGPIVGPRFVGKTNAGSHVRELLEEPITFAGFHWSTTPNGSRLLLFHGEVQSLFDQVTVMCGDGARVQAKVVDCSSRFGYNYFVAVVEGDPSLEAIAESTSDGTTASVFTE